MPPKRKYGQEHPDSFRTKRARTTRRPGRRSAKKPARRRAVSRRTKIGAYAGALIAGKPVKMAKPGSRIRQRVFGQEEAQNKLWIGANNISSEYYLFSLITEGIVAHILKRIGDTRTDKDFKVGGSTYGAGSIMSNLIMNFKRDDNSGGVSSDTGTSLELSLTQDTSFNGMVYNQGDGASPPSTGTYNTLVVSGVTQAAGIGLNKAIWNLATKGYYPSELFVFRQGTGGASTLVEILRETELSRMNIKLDIDKVHKFQNVTPANAPDGETVRADYSVNAIDANPLEGKMYTFRNLSPTWNKAWVGRQGNSNALENWSGRPLTTSGPGVILGWDYKLLGNGYHLGVSTGLDITEFEAPPLRPTTIFANCKTTGKVRFPPGGFKVFKTKFTYDGSIRKLVRDITQIDIDADGENLVNGKYPSLGDSFTMCLMPTIKTQIDESVRVAYDFVTDGRVHCTKYKGGSLPTTNFIQ